MPRGAASQTTPATAATTAQPGGACCCHTAPGNCASHSSGAISVAKTVCAACHSASSGSRIPASASGTTAKVTTGIASALASGEIAETCWNSARVSGTNPMVTSNCVRVATRSA